MNCTVHVRKDGCEVWVGNQVLARAQAAAAKTAGLPLGKVVVHNHLIGGGFGRRLEIDGVIRAVEIAKQVDGPVKVVWNPRGRYPARHVPAFSIETGGDSVEEKRPVHVVLDIFLAGPDDLDWTVDLFAISTAANDAIDLQATAEATADQMIVDHDLAQRQGPRLMPPPPGPVRGPGCRPTLRSRPCGHELFTVHRLHRGLREERHLISRLDLGGGARHTLSISPIFCRHGARILRRPLEAHAGCRPCQLGVRTIVHSITRPPGLSWQPPYGRPRRRRVVEAARSDARL